MSPCPRVPGTGRASRRVIFSYKFHRLSNFCPLTRFPGESVALQEPQLHRVGLERTCPPASEATGSERSAQSRRGAEVQHITGCCTSPLTSFGACLLHVLCLGGLLGNSGLFQRVLVGLEGPRVTAAHRCTDELGGSFQLPESTRGRDQGNEKHVSNRFARSRTFNRQPPAGHAGQLRH